MASVYTINHTDPAVSSFVILPSSEDQGPSGHTSLRLHGRGRLDWGEAVNENFLQLLESFASPENASNPGNPDPVLVKLPWVRGQIWYNSTDEQIYVFKHTGSPIGEWIPFVTLDSSGSTVLDGTYLRLDTTNDPLTGDLDIGNNNIENVVNVIGTYGVGTTKGVQIGNGTDPGNIQLNNGVLAFNVSGADWNGLNVDHIWFDDTPVVNLSGIFYFTSDGIYKQTPGNSGVAAEQFLADTSGTTSDPSYTWLNDSNTGMYNVTNDTIGFTTNADLKLTISDTETISYQDIRFDISTTPFADSKGLRWLGNTDEARIYVEETTGAETSNLVLLIRDNTDDTITLRHANVGSLSSLDMIKARTTGTEIRGTDAAVLRLDTTQTHDFAAPDHGYITYYTDKDNPTERKAFIGIPGVPSTAVLFSIGIDNAGSYASNDTGTFTFVRDTTTVVRFSPNNSSILAFGGSSGDNTPNTGVNAPAFAIENTGYDLILGRHNQVTRGNTGTSRALVKDTGAVLSINHGNDFAGGTRINSLLNMTSNQIINMAAPTSGLHAANKDYVDAKVAIIQGSVVNGGAVPSIGGYTNYKLLTGMIISKPTNNIAWSATVRISGSTMVCFVSAGATFNGTGYYTVIGIKP